MNTITKDRNPIIVERSFNAPAATVWAALTDKMQMKQWYFDLEAFEPVIGFEFEFSGGPPERSYLHKCVIKAVDPLKKLAHSWRYDGFEGDSLVTWQLFGEGDETRLVLTHSGTHTFPNEPDFAQSNFRMGWDHIVNVSLRDFLEGTLN